MFVRVGGGGGILFSNCPSVALWFLSGGYLISTAVDISCLKVSFRLLAKVQCMCQSTC